MMIMRACREYIEDMIEACLESKEPTSVQVESITVHEEVPKEEVAVKTVTLLKKQ
jgi:hypothetical protein